MYVCTYEMVLEERTRGPMCYAGLKIEGRRGRKSILGSGTEFQTYRSISTERSIDRIVI